MAKNILIHKPSDEDDESDIMSQVEHRHLSNSGEQGIGLTTFKSFPQTIIESIENHRRTHLPYSHSAVDFQVVQHSSIDTTDDDIDENYETLTTTTTTTLNSVRKRDFLSLHPPRSSTDVQITLYPDESKQNLTTRSITLKNTSFANPMCESDPSLLGGKSSRQNRADMLRRNLLENRLSRRTHASLSSALTPRSLTRRRSAQNFMSRANRRHGHYISRKSKWHVVRNHLNDVAMMSESYARMKVIERDLRWMQLREQITAQLLDMREMSLLRQQDDGILKKRPKTSIDLKMIPMNGVVYVEQDGRIYSMNTRDLVLGRFLGGEDVQLDTIAQLQARRKFQVKQSLLKRQEGRTRLKRKIAFSFCLCNLSFIVLMFVTMFVFAMTTIAELRSKEFF